MNTVDCLQRIKGILEIDMSVDAKTALSKLANDLTKELRAEQVCAAGNGKALRVVTAMLANAPREACRNAWYDEEHRQCFCDGYRSFRLKEPLPVSETDYAPFDLSKAYPDLRRGYTAIPLPTAAEVKAFIALHKRNSPPAKRGHKDAPPLWDFGKYKPQVNALYLLDLLTVLPDATEAYCRVWNEPVVVKSERGDAMMLGTMKDRETVNWYVDPDERVRAHCSIAYGLAKYDHNVFKNPDYACTPDDFMCIADALKRV